MPIHEVPHAMTTDSCSEPPRNMLDAAVLLQKVERGRQARKAYRKGWDALSKVQAWRHDEEQHILFQRTVKAVLCLQRWYRKRIQVQQTLRAVLILQSWFRKCSHADLFGNHAIASEREPLPEQESLPRAVPWHSSSDRNVGLQLDAANAFTLEYLYPDVSQNDHSVLAFLEEDESEEQEEDHLASLRVGLVQVKSLSRDSCSWVSEEIIPESNQSRFGCSWRSLPCTNPQCGIFTSDQNQNAIPRRFPNVRLSNDIGQNVTHIPSEWLPYGLWRSMAEQAPLIRPENPRSTLLHL